VLTDCTRVGRKH